ncbi:TetR family transcriptional regulator [Mycobacterium sp. 852002-51163_SCH5372311]|uniref:TetR/AcrR family transcriptional regulator n=1 Tax=Mycobacterium sp. 852002-51163_SCH5372311 TaxID=1834097 RepID=UPI0007FFBEFA|nr:TetR/AcrR family transcriptional regulator [Mycobacterium sp. 852002-51163_SCH5372311]OBF86095.1 TetR family transcriptional regulator [Mycobacterium sp. 852002-51163_SCH5372311]
MSARAAVRGRPRDPRTERDIMDATRRLLVRDGYEQVTIDAIAREAGVSRPTVYRRWPSKAHVVFEAAFGQPSDAALVENSGDFETDLLVFVREVLRFWREPVVEAAALGILADRHRDRDLHIRTQQLLDERTLTEFTALVRSGVDQGLVRRDVDVDMLYQMLVGTAFYAAQIQQNDDIDILAERLCAMVIRGAAKTKVRKHA